MATWLQNTLQAAEDILERVDTAAAEIITPAKQRPTLYLADDVDSEVPSFHLGGEDDQVDVPSRQEIVDAPLISFLGDDFEEDEAGHDDASANSAASSADDFFKTLVDTSLPPQAAPPRQLPASDITDSSTALKKLNRHLTDENEQLSRSLNRSRTGEAELRKKLEQVNKSREQEAEESQSTISALQEELEASTNAIDSLRKGLKQSKSAVSESVRKKEEKIKGLYQKVKEAEAALQKSHEDAEDERAAWKKQVRELQRKLEDGSQNLASAQAASEQRSGEAQRNKKRVRDLEVQLAKLRGELAEYRAKAETVLSAKDDEIRNLQTPVKPKQVDTQLLREKDQWQAQAAELDSLVHELRQELSEEQQRLSETRTSLQERIDSLTLDVGNEKKRSSALDIQLMGIKAELTERNSELQAAKKQNTLCAGELEKSRSALQSKLTEDTGGEVQELERRLRKLSDVLVKKQSIIDQLNSEKSSLLLRIEQKQMMMPPTPPSEHVSVPISGYSQSIEESKRDERVVHTVTLCPSIAFSANPLLQRISSAANKMDHVALKAGLYLRNSPALRLLVMIYVVFLPLSYILG